MTKSYKCILLNIFHCCCKNRSVSKVADASQKSATDENNHYNCTQDWMTYIFYVKRQYEQILTKSQTLLINVVSFTSMC